MTDLWTLCRPELEHHPSAGIYLAHSRARIAGDVLQITVLTPWARAWLDTRLRPVIQDTVDRIAGRPVQISFLCES